MLPVRAVLGSCRLMRQRALGCFGWHRESRWRNYWLAPAGSFVGLLYVRTSDVESECISYRDVFYLYRAHFRVQLVGRRRRVGFLPNPWAATMAARFSRVMIFFASRFGSRQSRTPAGARPVVRLVHLRGFAEQTMVTIGLQRSGVARVVVASALSCRWLALLSWRFIEGRQRLPPQALRVRHRNAPLPQSIAGAVGCKHAQCDLQAIRRAARTTAK